MVWIVVIIVVQAIDAYQDHRIHEYLRDQDYRILEILDTQIDTMEKLGEYLGRQVDHD